jgi:hypothetical protein
MKHSDPVMQEVWQAKEANAKKHPSLAAYMAYLRKQGKRKHAGGRVACTPVNAQTTL